MVEGKLTAVIPTGQFEQHRVGPQRNQEIYALHAKYHLILSLRRLFLTLKKPV